MAYNPYPYGGYQPTPGYYPGPVPDQLAQLRQNQMQQIQPQMMQQPIPQQMPAQQVPEAPVPMQPQTDTPARFCPACGKPVPADALFCVECGVKLEN